MTRVNRIKKIGPDEPGSAALEFICCKVRPWREELSSGKTGDTPVPPTAASFVTRCKLPDEWPLPGCSRPLVPVARQCCRSKSSESTAECCCCCRDSSKLRMEQSADKRLPMFHKLPGKDLEQQSVKLDSREQSESNCITIQVNNCVKFKVGKIISKLPEHRADNSA